jgi:hypothetical protein
MKRLKLLSRFRNNSSKFEISRFLYAIFFPDTKYEIIYRQRNRVKEIELLTQIVPVTTISYMES